MSSRRSIGGAMAAGLAALCLLLLAGLPLQAAERVNLKNGFHLLCDHHQTIGSKVRLYTEPGNEDYLEVDAAQIQSTVAVPDPPPLKKAAEAGAGGAKLSQTELRQILTRAGAEHNLDVDLLASVVRAESGGDPRAVSRAGAEGLMQLMPATAAELGVENSFGPAQNINGGTAYLDALLTRYHENLALALAAYNAGPAAVDRFHGVPPFQETRRYVARVIHEFNRRKAAEMASRRAPRSLR